MSALKATTKFGTLNVYSYSVEKNLISFRRDNVLVGTDYNIYNINDCYMTVTCI